MHFERLKNLENINVNICFQERVGLVEFDMFQKDVVQFLRLV